MAIRTSDDRGDVPGIEEHSIGRYRDGVPESGIDVVAVEEPLGIDVSGQRLSVTMRTPGHDHELAVGFLYAEGIIRSADEVVAVAHCGATTDPDYGSTIAVELREGVRFSLEGSAARRGTLTTAACGVCGRQSIEDLLARCTPVGGTRNWRASVVATLPDVLRARQLAFEDTGGTHAAAMVSRDGVVACAREDVGRHNAVDKVLGRLLLDGRLPATDSALVVSGRSSFEIVQKAAAGGAALVVSVSAPSSLAITTADRANVTLVGFTRNGSFNVYTHPARID